MSELIGQTLGQYRIIEKIGQGGMATVYKAFQPGLDRYVALKILPLTYAQRPGFRERFQREARAIANLNHPNILPVYDFGQEGEYNFIVMRYIEGAHTLKEKINPSLPLTQVVPLISQVAAALEAAHRQGIVHRDVKPGNVLLDGDWALLGDFGLARTIAGTDRLTESGAGIGTPAYMSPEQGHGEAVDHRTDIYALGVMLFEMVTGQIPHDATTPHAIIVKRLTQPPPSPRVFNPGLPEAVERIILQALAMDREERFSSAIHLAEALRAVVEGQLPDRNLATLPSSGLLKTPAPPAPLFAPVSLVTHPSNRLRTPSQGLVPAGAQLQLPPPPETTKTPSVLHFIGRTTELVYYAEKLAASRLAVITGMAGVGKTALAAHLARQIAPPERICWHTLYEDDGIDALLWTIAAFLARRDRLELWQMLQSARLTGGQPPPVELLFDYVVQALRGQGVVLCLDDLHLLQDDPNLADLLNRLQPLLQAAELALIITSRRVFKVISSVEFTPLTGLSRLDANKLLENSDLALTDELATQLHAYTEGNTELLTLAINILRQASQPERILARLAEADDIERYLIKEVDEQLKEADREIMITVAILLGYPGTREAIETVADRRRLKNLLLHLVDHHLLHSHEGELAEEYSEHAIVQAFYYDVPSRRERQEMHRRAAEYYEQEEPNPLRAARHYEQAGVYNKAAELATADIWATVNQGQARPLRHLLERLTITPLSPGVAIQVRLALGEIYVWMGENEASRLLFQEALAQIAPLSGSPAARVFEARACQGMGASFRNELPAEALKWLHQGLEAVREHDLHQEAGLYIEIGLVQYNMGNFSDSLISLEEGLKRLPQAPSRLQATALLNLGNIWVIQGQLHKGGIYTKQALEISEYLHDYFRMLAIWHNLGIDHEIVGEWQKALEKYEQALQQAGQLGAIQQQVGVNLSLGILKMKQVPNEAAQVHFKHCLALAEKHHLKVYMILGKSSLAEWHLRRGEFTTAAPLLIEAENLLIELGTREPLPELYREFAYYYLLSGELPLALAYAEQSLLLAHELEMKLEEGQSQRVLGEIRLALTQPEAAMVAFQQSLILLEETGDPYETARTQAAWGRALLAGPDQEQGRRLLETSRVIFDQLGAQRDLAQVITDLVGS